MSCICKSKCFFLDIFATGNYLVAFKHDHLSEFRDSNWKDKNIHTADKNNNIMLTCHNAKPRDVDKLLAFICKKYKTQFVVVIK